MDHSASILIVDDIAANRDTLCELLDAPEYRLVEAANGPTALRLAAENPPDLVLLDVMMPGMGGYEVCRQMRANPRLAEVPIIMVTALDDSESMLAGLDAGADDFLAKPLNRAILRARVRTITRLNRYRRLMDARSALQMETVEHHLAEESLRLLGAAMEQANDSIMITDAELPAPGPRILFVNSAFTKMTGYTAAEAFGKTPRILQGPASDPAVLRELREKLGRGEIFRGETINYRKNGEAFDLEWHVSPIRNTRGEVTHFAAIQRDVTARKQTERALRQSEEQYRGLFDSIEEGFCIVEVMFDQRDQPVNYRYLQVNPSFETQSGLIEATGKTALELIPNLEATWFERMGLVALTGESIRFVSEVKELERWFDVHAFRLGQAQSRKVAVLFNDITRRRLAEHTLRASEERFRAMFDLGPIAIYSCDAAGTLQQYNRRAAELWGREPQLNHQEDRFCGAWRLYQPDGSPMSHATSPMAMVLNGSFPGAKDVEVLVERPDGMRFPAILNIVPLKNSAGQITGAINSFYDITERKQAEENIRRINTQLEGRVIERTAQLEAANQESQSEILDRKRIERALQESNVNLETARWVADKANLAKSEFLSSMSHELRSPLNAILGFAQLMEAASPPPTASQKARIAQILQAGWYLLKLINEILDLASIESGKVSLSPEPVLLSELLSVCQDMMESQAHLRGIRMTFPQVDNTMYVHADRTRLQQIVVNLLSNAIKYNKEQGTVIVECAASAPGRVRLSFKDTGAGLPPEKLAQLFQPFNRLGQETGTVPGTGIGLVVTKRLVEKMDGAIGVESAVGVGSVFWCEFNSIEAPQLEVKNAKSAARAHLQASANGAKRTLLYIEDNPANLELVEQIIAEYPNLRLVTAVSGTLGIEVARATQPQVILMDINLPGISGLTALQILRDDPATMHIPVVALSANAMPQDIVKGLEAGFLRYLTKPIRVQEFMDALNEVLEFAAKTKGGMQKQG
jgi:PAS domain S-box-containing protein